MNTNNTTENFFKALEQYQPPNTEPVVWKLCYDRETGVILELTTEKTDLDYIEITRETADTNPHLNPYARVINEELIYLERKKTSTETIHKLGVKPDSLGDIATDSYNMLLLDTKGQHRWYYE